MMTNPKPLGVLFLSSGLDRTLDVAICLASGDVFTLIVELLAARQPQLDLGAAALEVDPQRDQGEALALDLAGDAVDLAAMEQQLAWASRLMIEIGAGLLVGRDMYIVEPGLAADDAGVAAAQVEPPTAHRLDLAAGQGQPGLVGFLDKIIMSRLAVIRHSLVEVPIAACHSAVPMIAPTNARHRGHARRMPGQML